MAVNAFFTADFSSFNEAVKKADIKLREFESGAADVTKTLNKMTDSFSGRRIIQDATLMAEVFQRAGGSAAFTAAELQRMGAVGSEAVEKMRALGKDIPPGIQKIADQAKGLNTVMGRDMLGTLTKVASAFGIAFSVQTVIRFAGSLFDAASKAHDMALQLGVSAEAAQRFSFAAKQTGSSTEAVGKAISFMNRELSGGDKSTVKALRDAGLEFSAIRAMRPEDAFNAIATAIKGIADPMLQAELATKLFSRSGQELLPGIKEGFVEIGNSATVMSNKTVERLERAQDAWEALGNRVVSITGNMIASIAEYVEAIARSSFLSNAPKQLGSGDISLPNEAAARNIKTKEQLEAIAAAAKKAAEAQEKFADSIRDIVDVLSGGGAIDKATLYMQALDRTVDVTQMTADAQKILHNVLDDALVAYSRLGQAAPKAMRDAWLATAPLVPLTSDYARTLKDVNHTLELFAADSGQGLGMQGLADGTRTVLEYTLTWRDALSQVVDVLGVVGDRWASVAQGILRQSQAIVALWTSGSKAAAVGMAIGAAGQAIPTGTTAGKVGYGAAQGAAAGAPFAAVTGGASVAIGAGIGALIGWYQSGKAARQVNDVRDAFIGTNEQFHRMNVLAHDAGMTLERVLQAKTVQEFQAAWEELTEAIEFQNDAMEFVQETMDKYGLSVADMGTAWSQQALDKQAASLLQEFRALEAAGADVGLISEHMAEALNEYVQQALKAGTTVPLAMREILNQLAQQGLLVDDNGEAFESLEDAGLTFAESMIDVTQTLTEAIKALTDAIKRGLGEAITNLPPLNLGLPSPPDVNQMATGGYGRVTRPTLFLAGEAGAEDFAFSGVGKRFSGASSGRGGGTVILEMDRRRVAEWLVPELPGAIARYGLGN